jgi:glucose/arabinose dehydrogenase
MWRSGYSFLILLSFLFLEDVNADVNLADIKLPPGFSIEIYAEVPEARSLAKGGDGVVFVSNRRKDSIYAIVPAPGGRNRVFTIDDDLSTPNGIAYFGGDLYVAEISRVLVYRNIDGRIANPPAPEKLDIDLPSKSHHGWRYIGFGPDDKLYISIGAPCNICDEDGFARIIRMNPDGSNREIWAEGIRNSVGFTWHPETDELWFTDNGRDMLGDDTPPGELNHAPTKGLHFGYPYCHGGEVLDPEFGDGKHCGDYVAPAKKLDAHVAALGVKFYTGSMFPEEYQGRMFLAEHGSWNRSKKVGYRITQVSLVDGQPVAYEEFATGWLQGQETMGRPVDLLVMDDGALLVSDDSNGMVYRISYEGTE